MRSLHVEPMCLPYIYMHIEDLIAHKSVDQEIEQSFTKGQLVFVPHGLDRFMWENWKASHPWYLGAISQWGSSALFMWPLSLCGIFPRRAVLSSMVSTIHMWLT